MKYIKYIYKRTEKKLSFLSSVAKKRDSKGVLERFNSFIKTVIDERILSSAAKADGIPPGPTPKTAVKNQRSRGLLFPSVNFKGY